ncbi:hypothetical protein C3942_02185 [Solimonas fluminis]|uniref:Uncharacterized protein n=1 Tax=Solimonas fluminis TaxID=2086571 RepID=A0A2S5TL64_9GAMM|nr:hypothetical protein [Solimonas fluminis]PPE75724.1 hypothetical protein C3942_02185 [Solimonas fluminis]
MTCKKMAPAALSALLFCCSALAQEPTLLPAGGYPAHTCSKPELPQMPSGVGGNSEAMAYNGEVRIYNQKAQVYSKCITDYMNTGNADMARIQARINEAVAEANAR